MKERREKENKGAVVVSRAPASLLTSASMDASDVFGAAGVAQGTQLMLSPPPEEELRTQASPARRATHEPLALSSRSNQSQSDNEPQQHLMGSPLKAASKRKRTVTNTSMTLGSPQRATASNAASAQTPNPRLRKQGRHVDGGSPASSPRKGRHTVAEDLDAHLQSPTRRSGTSSKPPSRSRTDPIELLSPHVKNPLADYISPSLLTASPRGGRAGSARRRSVTPIPPYEPPPERFTPPREIMGTPIGAAEAAKKKKERKKRGPQLHMPHRVKQEPPEIDLNAPLPPPSPGDDPILLVGPPTPKERLRRRRSSGLSKEASLVEFEMELDFPENAPRNPSDEATDSGIVAPSPRRAVVPVFDFSGIGEDDCGGLSGGDFDGDAGGFSADNSLANGADFAAGGADSDSSDDDLEGPSMGEGDFTGRFLEFHKRTKNGPPKDRVDRPVSPHPKRLSLDGVQPDDRDELALEVDGRTNAIVTSESEKEEEQEPDLGRLEESMMEEHSAELSQDESSAQEIDDHPVYEDKRGRRLTLSEVEAIKFGPRDLSPHQHEEVSHDASRGEETSMEDNSMEQHEDKQTSGNLEIREEDSIEMDTGYTKFLDDNILNKRPLLQEYSHISCISTTETAVDPQEQVTSDEAVGSDVDEDSSSDDAISDTSVVKIMSDDPMAAARAAAILKMYDYDMIAKKLKRKRRATSGGVSKRYSSPKIQQTWRRRTVAGLAAEEDLLGNITLPELLEKAEQELITSPARSRRGSTALSDVGSPIKASNFGLGFTYESSDLPGPREWVKADWKLLDSCFTDERYDLGEEQGLEAGCLACVDDINLQSVIDRFVEFMGGLQIVESHGSSWTHEKLLNRVRALCKRQRSGNGAPPTPDVSSRFSTPTRFLSPTPSMIVPDFTPMGAGRISKAEPASPLSRKAHLPPPASEPFFRSASLQPSLPSRQSHLRQDVTTAVLETPPRQSVSLFGFATPRVQQSDGDSDDESVALEVENLLTPRTAAQFRSQTEPGSAVKRSLSYINSWLKPGMFAPNEEKRRNEQQLPGLPVPPSDVLDRPRGPVETPAPRPAEKIIPPKDQVTLQQAPPPCPLPAPHRKPRRLVDLQHVPTPESKPVAQSKQQKLSRRSSVKDLVLGFETMESQVRAVPPRVAELRKMGSMESMKAKGKKPAWKP